MTAATAAPPVLAELVRGSHVESRHRGAIAVCSPDGTLLAAAGDAESFIFLRSAAKPFQLLAFVASGLAARHGFSSEELAVMAASHSGEDRHVAIVEGLLARASFSTSVLKCGTHTPYDAETAERLLLTGEALTPLRHNCSGKHAVMTLFPHAAGWPVDTYWEPGHPVQRAALASIASATDVDADAIALSTDGCGVPTFGVPLRGLATAFARLADPTALGDASARPALASIRDAMMTNPEVVAGQRRRLDTALMRSVGGLLAKAGAEGIQAIALQPRVARGLAYDGPVGVALVIEDGDGARRATSVAACAALSQLGAIGPDAAEALESFSAPVIRDPRGEISARVVPTFEL